MSDVRILLVNNEGGGFADYTNVETGTTVGELFQAQMGGQNTDNFLVRVNREPAAMDYTLQANDRVTFTPTKIEGARL